MQTGIRGGCKHSFVRAAVHLVMATEIVSPDEAFGTTRIPSRKPALERERLGLYSGADFRLTTGRCQECSISRAALWYFQDELIAIPRRDDRFSPFVWIGAPEIIEHATLVSDQGLAIAAEERPVPLALTPKIPSNRSYYDESSTAYFLRRPLRLRGATLLRDRAPVFVARTIWPEDLRIEPDRLVPQPLQHERALEKMIHAQMDALQGQLYQRLLWERELGKPRQWADRPVLAFVLSGAQGDDDESHGGHLSIATGRLGPRGEWADWLVNNFYPLDQVSEKGILAGMVPMDNYLMDLNSGQAYYRPIYLLVVVLRREHAAQQFQTAIQEVFHRFYCHDLPYHQATMNSTGMPIDTLREIGWRIPCTGRTGFVKAVLAFLYGSLAGKSFSTGGMLFRCFMEENTRIFPRAAFEAAALDLLRLLDDRAEPERRLTSYERMLQADVEAVLFLRVPQIPSSRAFGTYPVASFEEYRLRVPADRSKWATVPLEPRPFPSHLRKLCRTFAQSRARKR